MNWDLEKGNWLQIKGTIKEQWRKLTDDQLTLIDGREQLIAQIEKTYGLTHDEAEHQVDEWHARKEPAEKEHPVE